MWKLRIIDFQDNVKIQHHATTNGNAKSPLSRGIEFLAANRNDPNIFETPLVRYLIICLATSMFKLII